MSVILLLFSRKIWKAINVGEHNKFTSIDKNKEKKS